MATISSLGNIIPGSTANSITDRATLKPSKIDIDIRAKVGFTIYQATNTSSKVLGTVKYKDVVHASEKLGAWLKIKKTETGKASITGWIYAESERKYEVVNNKGGNTITYTAYPITNESNASVSNSTGEKVFDDLRSETFSTKVLSSSEINSYGNSIIQVQWENLVESI